MTVTEAQAARRFVEQQRSALLAALAHVSPGESYYYQNVVDAGAVRGYTPVQALVEHGLERAVERATWAHLGIEVVHVGFEDIDLSVFSRWPIELAMRHLALPIVGGRVAAPDPTDPDLIATVHAYLGKTTTIAALDDAANVTDLLTWASDRVQTRGLVDTAHKAAAAAAPAPAPVIEEADSSSSEIAELVHDVLRRAVERKASDVHFEPRQRSFTVRFRVDGLLNQEELPRGLAPAVVSRLKVMASVDVAQSRRPADGRFTFALTDGRTVDCRLVTLPTVWGESATIRLLDSSATTVRIAELGFSPANVAALKRIAHHPSGALLVAGPTGSGKTTTLYALLQEIARPERKVLTIEDPVEYRVEGVSQHQVDAGVGFTFATALRSFLRADPDVIMIGEVRDTETAAMAVDAAYTGHLVLSSFHASSAVVAPLRLIEMGVPPPLVAAGLSGILSQRLVRTLCPSCKVADDADYDVDWPNERPTEIYRANPAGCPHCALSGRNGYRGRAAVGELLMIDEELRKVIVGGADPVALRERLQSAGWQTMWSDGLAKVAAGVTSMAELSRAIVVGEKTSEEREKI